MNRDLLESVIRRTLVEMKDSPERSIRKLIDLGVDLCEGRFQKEMLISTQTMLKNPNSAYYRLVQDTVFHVDTDKLLTFGFNIGYNGFAQGAEKIRAIEKSEGYDIPWCVTIDMDDGRIGEYTSVMEQGEDLGIRMWILRAEKLSLPLFSLIGEFPESAFVVCASPAALEEAEMEIADKLNNLMVAVKYNEEADEDQMGRVCTSLRENGSLYAVYSPYTEKNMESIVNDELLSLIEGYNPVMLFLAPEYTCPMSVRKRVYSYVKRIRKKQEHKTILWDLYHDTNRIDSIISDHDCQAAFDKKGALVSYQKKKIFKEYNLFERRLCDIFKAAFPKEGVTHD